MLEVIGEVRDLQAPAAWDPGGDARATAVLAVLAGVAPETVARRYGVDPAALDGWVGTFLEAGREGLVAERSAGAERHRDRDRHLGLVAHELRSPLAMIRGWAELLEDADDEPAVRRQALQGILAQVDRLRRLADDALDATSAALGQLRLSLRPVMLGDAVRAVVGARPLDGPEVVVDDDVEVAIDLDRFGQILDNLLENARKHGAGPSRLRIGRWGRFGEVVVTSSGPRIEPEVARRLFEPFERGATSAEGVGLGLYVCRSLVAAHGGQTGLRVDQEGNHFWLRLPAMRGAHDRPAAR